MLRCKPHPATGSSGSRGGHRPTEAATHDDGVEITEAWQHWRAVTSVNEVKAIGSRADLVLLEADLELDAGTIERLLRSWRLLPGLRRRELAREPDA